MLSTAQMYGRVNAQRVLFPRASHENAHLGGRSDKEKNRRGVRRLKIPPTLAAAKFSQVRVRAKIVLSLQQRCRTIVLTEALRVTEMMSSAQTRSNLEQESG